MFRKLLIPLDRSYFAEEALARAVEIARESDAEIRLILVHQPIPYAGFNDIPWLAEQATAERKYLQGVVDELALKKVTATYAVLKGNPVELICEEAITSGCDLIVMASHGRTGFSRAWVGSVADGVIRNSSIPALLVRSADEKRQDRPERPHFKNILVPLDGSVVSEEIIPFAVELAQCECATIILLQVVNPVSWVAPVNTIPFAYSPMIYDEEITKNVVAQIEGEIEDTERRVRELGVPANAYVEVSERIAQTIGDFVKAHDIDAIAMSTHGRGASRLLLGSVTDKVLRSVDVPILFYRPPKEHRDRQVMESIQTAKFAVI